MKTILLALMLALPILANENVKVLYTVQTNSPMCEWFNLGCPPPEARLAGIIASAKSNNPSVIAYRFVVTAKSKSGETLTQTQTTLKNDNPSIGFSSVVFWLGKELGDFSDVRVTATELFAGETSTEATQPGVVY